MKRNLFTALVVLGLSLPAFAGHHKHGGPIPEPTKEQRVKMAEMHDKMAACLRSEQTMAACHEEMNAACEASGDSCPMMGHHHGKKAWKKGRGGAMKKDKGGAPAETD